MSISNPSLPKCPTTITIFPDTTVPHQSAYDSLLACLLSMLGPHCTHFPFQNTNLLIHSHTHIHTHPCLKAFSGFPYVLWSWSKYLIWPKKPFGIYPSSSLQPQLVLAFLWVSASQTFICKKAPYSLLYEVFAQTFLWPESSFSPLPFATWLLASSSSFRTQSWLLNLRELFHDSAQEYKILCFNTATQQASLFQNL